MREAGSKPRLEKPAGEPPIPKFPARGSRPKTENKGFAGGRARTVPAAGPTIKPASTPTWPAPLPSGPGTTQKTPGGSPAFLLILLSSYPRYPVIYSSGLRSIPSNPSRYAFSSGSTSEMPPSWVASTFSGSTGSCRDFRRRNQPVCPFKS